MLRKPFTNQFHAQSSNSTFKKLFEGGGCLDAGGGVVAAMHGASRARGAHRRQSGLTPGSERLGGRAGDIALRYIASDRLGGEHDAHVLILAGGIAHGADAVEFQEPACAIVGE